MRKDDGQIDSQGRRGETDREEGQQRSRSRQAGIRPTDRELDREQEIGQKVMGDRRDRHSELQRTRETKQRKTDRKTSIL